MYYCVILLSGIIGIVRIPLLGGFNLQLVRFSSVLNSPVDRNVQETCDSMGRVSRSYYLKDPDDQEKKDKKRKLKRWKKRGQEPSKKKETCKTIWIVSDLSVRSVYGVKMNIGNEWLPAVVVSSLSFQLSTICTSVPRSLLALQLKVSCNLSNESHFWCPIFYLFLWGVSCIHIMLCGPMGPRPKCDWVADPDKIGSLSQMR